MLVVIGVLLVVAGRLVQRQLVRQARGRPAAEFTTGHGFAWLGQGVVGVTGLALLLIGIFLTLT
jgi:hypothetical protein